MNFQNCAFVQIPALALNKIPGFAKPSLKYYTTIEMGNFLGWAQIMATINNLENESRKGWEFISHVFLK